MRLPYVFNRIKSHSRHERALMRTTQQFSVTLPHELAAQVRSKVASGEYASESEVIREGLRALQARERALRGWLQGVVSSAYDAHKADPSLARSIDDVRSTLASAHVQVTQAR